MPTRNTKLTLAQRVSAIQWEAHTEKLAHFLCSTPSHPTLDPAAVACLFDEVETALLDLRCTFEVHGPLGERSLLPHDREADTGACTPSRD